MYSCVQEDTVSHSLSEHSAGNQVLQYGSFCRCSDVHMFSVHRHVDCLLHVHQLFSE